MRTETPKTDAAEVAAETGWADEYSPMYVRAEFARDLETRLAKIASEASCIRDEWIEKQSEGFRLVIANIRRLSDLNQPLP